MSFAHHKLYVNEFLHILVPVTFKHCVSSGKKIHYSGDTSVCVCHVQSVCKTVTGTTALGLVSRISDSLKKFSLFSFPLPVLWDARRSSLVLKREQKQTGLKPFKWMLIPSHGSKHINQPCLWLPVIASHSLSCTLSWAAQALSMLRLHMILQGQHSWQTVILYVW